VSRNAYGVHDHDVVHWSKHREHRSCKWRDL